MNTNTDNIETEIDVVSNTEDAQFQELMGILGFEDEAEEAFEPEKEPTQVDMDDEVTEEYDEFEAFLKAFGEEDAGEESDDTPEDEDSDDEESEEDGDEDDLEESLPDDEDEDGYYEVEENYTLQLPNGKAYKASELQRAMEALDKLGTSPDKLDQLEDTVVNFLDDNLSKASRLKTSTEIQRERLRQNYDENHLIKIGDYETLGKLRAEYQRLDAIDADIDTMLKQHNTKKEAEAAKAKEAKLIEATNFVKGRKKLDNEKIIDNAAWAKHYGLDVADTPPWVFEAVIEYREKLARKEAAVKSLKQPRKDTKTTKATKMKPKTKGSGLGYTNEADEFEAFKKFAL